MNLVCKGGHQHITLEGFDENGNFKTSVVQTYPPEMCRMLALVMMDGLEVRPRKGGRKHVAPPIQPAWHNLERWRLVYTGLWSRQEHINVTEARVIVQLARRLARSQKEWHKKHLVLTDSMVTLGALGKGRSSTPSLLALCRRMMVLRLCMGVKLYLRHVVSHMNYADGPSRGHPVGAAPETKKKGEEKVTVRRGQG